jgi:orotidine-5'-phosphate decarboxylase
MHYFADRLIKAIKDKGSPICVGLDPRLKQIPSFIKDKHLAKEKDAFRAAAESIVEFNKGIIEAVHDLAPIVKPQVAFYEQYGPEGFRALLETAKYAKAKGLLVLIDGKRNDIGSTAEAYANIYLGKVDLFGEAVTVFDADALTVTPYLGVDGVKPFIEECKKYGKGIFILVKTSNKSAGDLQDRKVDNCDMFNYELMASFVESWGADEVGESGYSSVGAVVGATYPKEAERLRKLMPRTIFLVPGYGAQGAGAADCKPCFNKDGTGAIINNSRGIIFAYEKRPEFGAEKYAEAARAAVEEMKRDIVAMLK